MKISVDEDKSLLLEEVFSGVGLKTQDGEYMGICMRDSGFEFNYNGKWYSAQKGVVKEMIRTQNVKISGKSTGGT
jgi:hypothetical protein